MVLLPEPFGPSNPTISPSATENETSRIAGRGPYHLTRFRTRTIAELIAGAGSPLAATAVLPRAGCEDPARSIRANACAPGGRPDRARRSRLRFPDADGAAPSRRR